MDNLKLFKRTQTTPKHQILGAIPPYGPLRESELVNVWLPLETQNMSSLCFVGDLKGLRPRVLLGNTFSLATPMGLFTAAQSRSMNGESAGFNGATLRERLGLPLVEHGAEREMGKGAEKGSNGEGSSEFIDGSALRLKGSQSGDGKGSQFMKGLVGDGLYPSRGLVGLLVELACRELHFSIPAAEMKLQGSIRGRLGDGRGRGMMFTSRRRVFGLQR